MTHFIYDYHYITLAFLHFNNFKYPSKHLAQNERVLDEFIKIIGVKSISVFTPLHNVKLI